MPLARIASSTLNVAMVFCSRSLARMLGAEAHVGVGREMEDELAAAHRRGQALEIERVAFDQREAVAIAAASSETGAGPVEKLS